MAGDDWGLDAVVRSCRLSSSSFPSLFPSSFPIKEEEESTIAAGTRFPDLLVSQTETGNALHELEELCKPFFSKPQPPPKPSSSPAAHRSISQLSRSKRRKNQQKKVVCHVPADGLGSDIWAWRKYGQKPIKGSPYPRGYYRCSSSKGCMARKQVERSRGDPGVLVVTYTAEHNHPAPTHRNSLAGSTRSKYSTTGGGPLSSPTTPLTVSMEDELLRRQVQPEKSGEEEDEEEELMVEDMEVVGEDELLFVGLDGEMSTEGGSAAAAASVQEDSDSSALFDGRLFSPPLWLANNHNAAATAGAGCS